MQHRITRISQLCLFLCLSTLSACDESASPAPNCTVRISGLMPGVGFPWLAMSYEGKGCKAKVLADITPALYSSSLQPLTLAAPVRADDKQGCMTFRWKQPAISVDWVATLEKTGSQPGDNILASLQSDEVADWTTGALLPVWPYMGGWSTFLPSPNLQPACHAPGFTPDGEPL